MGLRPKERATPRRARRASGVVACRWARRADHICAQRGRSTSCGLPRAGYCGGCSSTSSSRTRRRPTSSSSMRSRLIRALPIARRPIASAPSAAAPTASAPTALEPITRVPMALAPTAMAGWRATSGALKGGIALLEERQRAFLEVARAREAVLQLGLEGELAVEVGIQHLVERPLRARVGASGARGEARDQGVGLVEQPVVRVDEVHESPVERALGLDPLAQQGHLERPCLADGGR